MTHSVCGETAQHYTRLWSTTIKTTRQHPPGKSRNNVGGGMIEVWDSRAPGKGFEDKASQKLCIPEENLTLTPVWFKLKVTVTEMTINGNKSNPLTVTVTVTETETLTVTEIPVKANIQLMPSWLTIRPLTSHSLCRYVDRNCGLRKIAF